MTNLNRELDAQLIERIRCRDEAALVEVIAQYGPQVKAVCRRICKDSLDADEILSRVFWELWNRNANYDSERGSLRAFLITVARSRAIDRQRASARQENNLRQLFDSQKHRSAGQEEVEQVPLALTACTAELLNAMSQLPTVQQQMIQLAFFDGLSHSEVAARQNVPLGTVKSHIRRGLLQLRTFLSDITATGRLT